VIFAINWGWIFLNKSVSSIGGCAVEISFIITMRHAILGRGIVAVIDRISMHVAIRVVLGKSVSSIGGCAVEISFIIGNS
jgi:hypothetical protein